MARKILLADDSVTAQNMGRKILADAGYEVITVNNGSAALKKINEQHPDVIVLDVYMPGYSGLEVCQRLKDVGETSRIPILLTVGKLEPFKPEEARRVRADGFIVKPFEASELLSALTKLEDKIVPHSESAKSGRFGRAAVALDDSRFDPTVAVEEDEGWKTRLRFPPKKKEKAEDNAASAADSAKKEEPVVAQAPVPSPSEKKATDDKVDLAALAPAGLPKDVTPEEIAALAAAAARMKGKFADDKVPSEKPVVTSASTDEGKAETPAAAESVATTKSMAGPGPIYVPEQKVEKNEPEAKPETKIDETKIDEAKKESSPAEAAAVEAPAVEAKSPAEEKPAAAKSEEAKPEEKPAEAPFIAPAAVSSPASPESAPEPVATAVAPVAESAPPRWTAVAVALAPEDSALSLEQEMQKAFAASAGAESSHTVAVSAAPANEAISATPASASEPLPAPTLSASVAADPELSSSAACSAAAELVTAAVNQLESMASSYAAQAPARSESAVVPSSDSPASAATETSPAATEAQASGPAPEISSEAPKSESPEPEKIESTSAQPVVAESRASEEVAAKTEPVILSPSPEVVSESSPATAEASLQSEARAAESSAQPSTDSRRREPEVADSTAAAWDSWKRVKDSGEETAETAAASPSPKHEDSPPQDTAAMAAAVGANSPIDEVKSDPESDPDVASIVDSVLADLRPKIVQEISRKLGKK